MKISKVKNLAGFVYHCAECGKEIKHAYFVESDPQHIMGSECVLRKLGYKYEKQLKQYKARILGWNNILNNPGMYNLDFYINAMGGIDNVENSYIEFGYLGKC